MSKVRGFEFVKGLEKEEMGNPILPTRADANSAGYDFYAPHDVTLEPGKRVLIFTHIKAYMQPYEVLKIYIRSSLAVKQGLMLANNVGIIDASYYNNEGNEGDIGICLVNTSPKTVEIKAGDRIAQGIFEVYLTADGDAIQGGKRKGGFGSSGK
jgi:dUTP pyrophosphatase